MTGYLHRTSHRSGHIQLSWLTHLCLTQVLEDGTGVMADGLRVFVVQRVHVNPGLLAQVTCRDWINIMKARFA